MKDYLILNEACDYVRKLSNSTVDSIIISHEKLLSELFINNRLFYKTVFKSFRFNLAAFLMSDFYNLNEATLFSVKEKFIPLGMMSLNSVSSFLGLLIVTDRIKVKRHKSDARKFQYIITCKLKNETYHLLNSLVTPLKESIGIKHPLNEKCIDEYLNGFFHNFVDVLNSGSFNFDDIEGASVFITRDSGHMILMKLFCNRKANGEGFYTTSSIKTLATECAVSRSHLKSILSQAEHAGLIINSGKESNFMLTERFCKLARDYMRKYMAFCIVGLGWNEICFN